MKNFYIILISILFYFHQGFSQTGNEFWFAVPEVSWQHNNGGGEPTIVRVSALNLPVTVTLSMPKADQLLFPPIERNIAAYATDNIDLTSWIRTGGASGIPPLVNGTENDNNIIESGLYTEYGLVTNKGILLEVTGGDVTAYLERNNPNNKDIFSLKAQNALGSDFWLVGQNFHVNHSYTTNPATLSAYDIVATKDGTIVTVKLPAGKTATRIGWNTVGGTYTINLERGQTFSIVANSRSVADHLIGTHVTTDADHPIAIMWKDDSLDNESPNQDGWDLCGDQLVPTNLAGTKYIIMRDNLGVSIGANRCYEFAYVTTTKPNTTVTFKYYNDVSGLIETSSSGLIPLAGTMVRKQLNEQFNDGTKPLIDALYIDATDSVLVSQISGSGYETGGAVIPRIDGCTGSLNVTINRSSADSCYLNIMTKSAHITDFFIVLYWNHDNNGTTPMILDTFPIPSTWFKVVPGTQGLPTEWYYLEKANRHNNFSTAHDGIPSIPFGQPTTVYNTSGYFHLGMLNGNFGGGGKYGYFSDFSENFGEAVIASSGSDYLKYCYQDTIQLKASGGLSYLWENASTPFADGTFIDPKNQSITRVTPPPDFHTYVATIKRVCYLGTSQDTNIYVAAYGYPEIKAVFDTTQIGPDCCSPYEMKYFNESIGANKHEWTFERVTDTLTSIIQNPEVVYFANTTYDVKEVKTSLKVSYTGNCPDTTSKLIPIKPQITAKGTKGTKSGCQQDVTKIFYADTTGAGPITSVYWNWGDGGETETLESNLSTLGTNPFEYSHTFVNLNQYDTAYFVTLVFIDSVNDCRDTLTPPYMDTVFVPGVARARFTVDKNKGCSPLVVAFDNVSNGDVTYEWDFGNGTPLATTGNDTSITFPNTTVNPISYFINLTITKANDDGSFCYDTYLDTITVYPQFNTVISPPEPLEGCNPFTVDFSQTTTPNVPNLQYEWDFGNGSTSGSSDPLPKLFQHALGTDQNYQVKLTTTSEFNCKSVATPVNVTVYAFVDAKFTVAPDTAGCSPLTLQVANNSHINSVKNFIWYIPGNLGDVPNDLAPFEIIFENKGSAPLVDTIRLSNNNPPHNCPVSTTKLITVNPEITPRYTKSTGTDTLCNNSSVTFTNTSYYTNVTDLVAGAAGTYLWEFGDGTTSALENPVKVFNNTTPALKTFKVKLNLTVNGCTKVYLDSVSIYPQVTAQFNTSSVNLCAPDTITLNNTSSGGTTYLWQFSDGSLNVSANNKNPIEYVVDNTIPNDVIQSKVYLTATTANCSHTDSLTLNVYPHIVPLVVPNILSGCGPLVVALANQTTGGNVTHPLTYLWNFGDGENSTLPDASVPHTFTNRTPVDAAYTISLTATNNLGCSASHSEVVTVFPEIEPKFSFKKSLECSPMEVFMQNSSLNGNQFNWDFGFDDNVTTVSGNFFYNFYHTNADPNLPDTYTIKLVVIDTNHPECKDSVSQPITINPPVVASFGVSNGAVACSPYEAEFTNNSTGYNLTYVWDYSDNNTSANGDNIHTHMYDNLGKTNAVFTVKLSAYDANGCPNVTTQTVTRYPKVVANFTLEKDINNTCTPYPIDFSYPETALNGNKFTWDFGEGNDTIDLAKETFKHTFDNLTPNTKNTYTIRLTSLDTLTGCTHDTTRTIEVYPHLIPQFRTSNDVYEGCNALTLQFDNQSTGLADYLWDFGDKQTSPETSPEHIFAHKENKSKDFNVLLKATQTATGCTKDISKVVTVYSYLNPKFGLRQDTKGSSKAGEPILGGCTPFDVVITDSSTTNYYWHWDFGTADYDDEDDNAAPAPRQLTYYNDDEDGAMQNKGYTITLIVENTEGCTKTTSQRLEVYPRAVPDFSVVQAGCHPLKVDFKNNSIVDDSSTYYWNLGDGATAIEDVLSHTYFNSSYFDKKVFEVKLTATTKNLCSDFITKKITVYPTPSAAIGPILDRGCSPLTANLINKSKVSSPATFLWDFNNGETEERNQITTEEPEYINNGDKAEVKKVQLIVRTDKGCSDTVIQLVNVYPRADASFAYYDPSDTAGCSPLQVEFLNLSNTTSTVYKWDFGNGATSQLRHPIYRFINDTDNDRVYTVTLNVESPFGCTDTIQHDIKVYLSPNAEFLALDPVKLYPDTVLTFQNLVKPGPWTFDWDYGDGHFSNVTKEVHDHVYTGWGPRDDDFSYIVWLKAFSDHCRDSIWQFVTINPPKPYINIMQRNPLGCVPLEVDFNVSYAFGYEDSIRWNFGNGDTSAERDPLYTYTESGLFISMVTIKGDGGIYIDTTKIYVHPLPEPSFEFRPDFVMLPDQPVQFYNTTYLVDESTYFWDFGDGTSSNEVVPVHQYTVEGVYDIKLVATTLHGCMDSVMSRAPVTVSGEGFIIFPNAFLPTSASPSNGSYPSPDTENDVFHPIHKGVKEYELWIFNRWGEQVFYSDNILVGWNGRYGNNGAELGQDVYFWKTKGNFNNDVPFKEAGDVTLIRR